jgi:phosphatidylethanolamine-binding protein (PEBP) family uncharacterized protein
MRKILGLLAIVIVASAVNGTAAQAFSFTFTWGGIPKCTSGNPNTVSNPIFSLSAVPKGATKIVFHLTDLNVPDFNHGGGLVVYSGQKMIKAGAFKYQSPCPPNGKHSYQWSAVVFDAAAKNIASATSSKMYP